MIDIKITDCSESISVLEINKVKSDSGFYFMRDSGEKIVYIGEALNLKKRLKRHMSGSSSVTGRFYHVFHSVDVFYCDRKDRKIYEIYAINLYDPIGNVLDNNSVSKAELKKRRNDWVGSL